MKITDFCALQQSFYQTFVLAAKPFVCYLLYLYELAFCLIREEF